MSLSFLLSLSLSLSALRANTTIRYQMQLCSSRRVELEFQMQLNLSRRQENSNVAVYFQMRRDRISNVAVYKRSNFKCIWGDFGSQDRLNYRSLLQKIPIQETIFCNRDGVHSGEATAPKLPRAIRAGPNEGGVKFGFLQSYFYTQIQVVQGLDKPPKFESKNQTTPGLQVIRLDKLPDEDPPILVSTSFGPTLMARGSFGAVRLI